jgi:aspartokinase-like uncharacterized kinase
VANYGSQQGQLKDKAETDWNMTADCVPLMSKHYVQWQMVVSVMQSGGTKRGGDKGGVRHKDFMR